VFRSCLSKFVDIVEGLRANGDYASLSNPMSREEISDAQIQRACWRSRCDCSDNVVRVVALKQSVE